MEQPSENNTLINQFLIFTTFVFNLFEKITVEQLYVWVFRILTLTSLILIIIINWNKAMKVLFNKNK